MNRSGIQFRKMPFARFLIVYLLGVGIGYYSDPNPAIYFFLIIAASISLCSFFVISIINRFKNFNSYRYLSINFYLFLTLLGLILTWKPHPHVKKLHFSRQSSEALIGYIYDEPKLTESSIRFPLKITHSIQNGKEDKSTGLLLVNIRLDSIAASKISSFQYGDEFIIPSRYSIVSNSYNPNEFNYKSYLADHLIWHQANLSAANIKQTGTGQGNVCISKALWFRKLMIEKLNRSLNNKDAVAIASALVLGYRNNLEQDILNTFSVTGTIHVLAVSGLHVGIIFVVFSAALFWMKGKNWLAVRTLLLLLFIWFYALLTGLSPSVLRASIMISIGIISFNFARKGNIYNTIAASAFFLLLYNPYFIAEIGFKLSYLAVLGIVILYPKINTLVRFKNKVLSSLWSYAALSISAQLATFPLVYYYFHFFPLYFLPANVVVILPVSFIVYLSVLVLLIPYGLVQLWLSELLENLILLMTRVLNALEQLPYATIKGIWIEPWHYLLAYLLFIGIFYFFIFKKKQAIYIVFGCLILFLSDQVINSLANRSLSEIRIYNVYKNMAIGFFDTDRAVIYTDSLTKETKRFQYSVAPNIDASGKSPAIIVNQGESLKSDNLIIIDNIIQFGNKRLLVYSKEQLFIDVLSVDLLYIRNNPKINLQDLQRNIRFKKVLLDASNTEWYIKQIKKEAENMAVPVYVLKNNFAYVW